MSSLDRLFNPVFSAEYNPLYRTGTIAVLLMTIVTTTGLILVFFYRLSEAYESIQYIQDRAWLSWLRAFHRYASDAAVVAVFLHVFRMFSQGKSWGPRIFAWITGGLLLLFLFISAWSGYAMVWDVHSQALVVAGAKIVDSLGILSDPIGRSFNGVTDTPPPSFFFFNLFIHVVVPLGMIFGMWVHTSKMARATWFPAKNYLIAVVSLFIAVSVLWPAPLDKKADLLAIPNNFSLDLFFGAWLPLVDSSPSLVFYLWLGAFFVLLTLPTWLKPKLEIEKEAAYNEQEKCQGCGQCVVDCPYEAIKMIPRTSGPMSVSNEVAFVTPEICVSCGLCSGSCGPMTMGPPDRKGTHHYQAAREFVSELRAGGQPPDNKVLIIGCDNQGFVLENLNKKIKNHQDKVLTFPSECMGTLHMGVVEYLATQFKTVYLAACPPRNCMNKDGHFLLGERLKGDREPSLLGRVPLDKIKLFPTGDGEENLLLAQVLGENKSPSKNLILKRSVSVLFGALILFGIAAASRSTFAKDYQDGVLRLSWRLAGQTLKDCRDRTPEELAKLPKHMSTGQLCTTTMLSYRLKIDKNGEPWIDEVVNAGGVHHDRPLYVDKDIKLTPGSYDLTISFEPENTNSEKAIRLAMTTKATLQAGRISLVYLSNDQKSLLLKETSEGMTP